jgi:hypothetical protein
LTRASAREPSPATNPLNLLPLPRWIGEFTAGDPARAGEGAEHATWQGGDPRFATGAAIFAIDQIVRLNAPWIGAWRMRLTLKAAATAAKRLRLDADEAALRDALHLTRAGDDPGPAGRLHLLLRRWASRPLRLAAETEVDIAGEITGSAAAADIAALIAADLTLAGQLGWESPLPLHLATIHDPALRGGHRRDGSGRSPPADEAGLKVMHHVSLLRSAMSAHAEAVTLARRADALTAAAASLRTRDEGRGLALILADDSVAPWRMAGKDPADRDAFGRSGKEKMGFGSQRAARRFCESLHARGALRLLTERPALRLYGL